MGNFPSADIHTSESIVRTLLRNAHLPYAEDTLELATFGWDNDIWRIGSARTVRLPRREVAARLIETEQRVLPGIAARLAVVGVTVPAPEYAGAPSDSYPWPWSVVPWIEGDAALHSPRGDRTGWAAHLARGLDALHVPADGDAPQNPFRGVPLVERDVAITARFAGLDIDPRVERAWRDAVATPAWSGAPVWIHGDVHPGNLVVRHQDLAAIIDFGDVSSGDPAYDLAAAWIVFDQAGRDVFTSALPRVDDDTWRRARGWAAAIGVTLLEASDDSPHYSAQAAEVINEIIQTSG